MPLQFVIDTQPRSDQSDIAEGVPKFDITYDVAGECLGNEKTDNVSSKINKKSRKKRKEMEIHDLSEFSSMKKKNLEELVFGTKEIADSDEEENEKSSSKQLCYEITTSESQNKLNVFGEASDELQEEKAVWDDDDDEEEDVERETFLRNEFLRLNSKKKLEFGKKNFDDNSKDNNVYDDTDDDVDDNQISSIKDFGKDGLILKGRGKLTGKQRHIGGVSSIQFSPTAMVAVTTGLNDHIFRVVQVDGEKNPELHSSHIRTFPIYSSFFEPTDGKRMLFGSTRPYFYELNLETGTIVKKDLVENHKRLNKLGERTFGHLNGDMTLNSSFSPDGKYLAIGGRYGRLHLLDGKRLSYINTIQFPCSMKMLTNNHKSNKMSTASPRFIHMNYTATPLFEWSSDSMMISGMTCGLGGNNNLYSFDLRNMSRDASINLDNYFTNDELVQCTAFTSNNKFIAQGCSSGVVQLSKSNKKKLETIKTFNQLTTTVDTMKWNTKGDVLTFLSTRLGNSLRFAFTPTNGKQMKLFNMGSFSGKKKSVNELYLSDKVKENRIFCFDWSPNSAYFAYGDENGHGKLFRCSNYDFHY
ncbi:hypothetical protein SNEBB_004060 [Seison nebaliae]|nr:hypothetical protein SNEBB_004060 [Seison nebaliae]